MFLCKIRNIRTVLSIVQFMLYKDIYNYRVLLISQWKERMFSAEQGHYTKISSPHTQVEYSGRRISLEHGSSIPSWNCPDFFRWIPASFVCFPAGTGRKPSKKFRPEYCFQNQWNYLEPAVSEPGCSTWVYILNNSFYLTLIRYIYTDTRISDICFSN